jgi:dCMP deaminase
MPSETTRLPPKNSTPQMSVQRKWDKRFLALAAHVALWSKDPSTKTGAVIVRPDRTVASIGYNGFPRGCNDDVDLYANRETKYARIVHCEMNAILAAREPLHGYTLYTVPFMSCDSCAAHVVQAGIVRCVAPRATADQLTRWRESMDRALTIFREAGALVDVVDE